MPLAWTRTERDVLLSDPPGFTIVRVRTGATTRYETWDTRRKGRARPADLLGVRDSADAAKKLADEATEETTP